MMTQNKRVTGFRRLSLSLLLLGGCAGGGITVESYWTPERKLGATATTFAWAPNGEWVAENPDLDRHLRDAIDAAMKAKGYRLDEKADYLVRYRIRRYVEMAQVGHESWEEGALAVDLFDAESRKLLWSGKAKARIEFDLPPEKARGRIDAAVRGVLQEFPNAGK